MSGGGRDPLLLRALRLEPVERTPIWLLRQAGRYLPEYRAVREKVGFLELCHDAELAARVTLDAVRALDVDAAILFSDILVPAEAMGAGVRFDERGPQVEPPVRDERAVRAIHVPDPEAELPFVSGALRILRAELAPEVALIGFAGAPYTVAAYLVEGRPTRDFTVVKRFLAERPRLFHELLERIAEATVVCLRAQVEAGAQAVQLFDSWAGFLDAWDFEEFALRHARFVLQEVERLGVPTILYANGTAGVLPLMGRSGASAVNVDWRLGLDRAWRALGEGVAIQGNLDPAALLGPEERFLAKARAILAAAGGRPGHVFNLGAGLLKETPPDHVRRLVEVVREESGRGVSAP